MKYGGKRHRYLQSLEEFRISPDNPRQVEWRKNSTATWEAWLYKESPEEAIASLNRAVESRRLQPA